MSVRSQNGLRKRVEKYILPLVHKPGRYLGTEINRACKPWEEAEVRFCLLFPDLYEIGMSHLGLHILYSIVNDTSWALADRAYCPDTDMEKRLRQEKLPLWGLETGQGLKDFDILAITLPYELCYSNILTMLDLANIPLFSGERLKGEWPLILGGGSCSVQPEPVADFFDAILIGDGEEKIIEIGRLVKEAKGQKIPKGEILRRLSKIQGVYVPSLYKPIYANGIFKGIEPRGADTPEMVERAILPDLDKAPFPSAPLLPTISVVHDRLGLEIARGCTRGCRFCQAGITYRPVRERAISTVLEMADRGLESTGWEELSLLSLSTGDYSCITTLIEAITTKYLPQKTAVSLPSLRVGTLTPRIMELIRGIRKTGFTLAPEAGSERLRKAINKGITEEDLLKTAEEAFKQGWSNIKLYFMIGLPTETQDDVTAIGELARKVLATASKGQVTISVGTFVPKPHTPFQWERQISEEESRRRLQFLKKNLGSRAIKMKWHDPRQSFLEGIFSRGDRRLAKVLHKAWQKGARLDAWTDRLDTALYAEAAKEEGLDIDVLLLERDPHGPLPWDHISMGVETHFLRSERRRAHELAYTSDCRTNKCHKCGVCDFKQIKPVVQKKCTSTPIQKPVTLEKVKDETQSHTILLTYSKLGLARFLGHLDILHAFHRAIRRAHLPVAYSQGFHPMPKVSFGRPIPLGTESLVEKAAMVLTEPIDMKQIAGSLNKTMPEGVHIEEASAVTGKKALTEAVTTRYLILPFNSNRNRIDAALGLFHESKEWMVKIVRKNKILSLNAKEVFSDVELVDPKMIDPKIRDRWEPLEEAIEKSLFLITISLIQRDTAQIKPSEFIKTLLKQSEEESKLNRILKIGQERPRSSF